MDFETIFPMRMCLNLARRQDRRALAEELFYIHGMRVERWPAIDARFVKRTRGYQTPGRYAHALSTRLIIREAKRRKAPAVFIFEDDVSLLPDWRERLQHLTLPEDWGIFYLGCQHHERPEVVHPLGAGYSGLLRVRAALDTHAWGLHARYYDTVLQALNWRNHSSQMLDEYRVGELVVPATDVTLARLHRQIPTYTPFPQVAGQLEDRSDLLNSSYSNYCKDQQQKVARESLAGVMTEILGGRTYEQAVSLSLVTQAWFHGRDIPPSACQVTLDASSEEAAAYDKAEACAETPPLGKTAFLFLVREHLNHPQIWDEYFSAVPHETTVYSHRKFCPSSSDSSPNWWRKSSIEEHVETAWGTISLLKAQLALLRKALSDPTNEHFIFLSESCIPIRPLRCLRRMLRLDRRSRFHWEDHTAVQRKDPEKAARVSATPAIPFSWWRFHSQWILLHREAAELLAYDDLLRYWEHVFAPEEAYAGTMLEAAGFPLNSKVVPQTPTWTRWEPGSPHPIAFQNVSPQFAAELTSSGCYFARKFLPQSNIGKYGLHN